MFGEWENPYLTMNFAYEANVIRSLATITERNYIRRGFKPVYWCIDCGSALAEAEVEYADKRSYAVDVRFVAVDEADFLNRCRHTPEPKGHGPISVPIWTTTPDFTSEKLSIKPRSWLCGDSNTDERLLVAEDWLNAVVCVMALTSILSMLIVSGSDLEGVLLQHPFYDKQVPIVLPSMSQQTMVLVLCIQHPRMVSMITVGVRYDLPLSGPVQGNGCYVMTCHC